MILIKIILIVSSIVAPLLMVYFHYLWGRMYIFFNLLMLISLLTFGNIASLSIFQIIRDNTVFMTAIHGIFLNQAFLVSGAYIGLYTIYRFMLMNIEDRQL